MDFGAGARPEEKDGIPIRHYLDHPDGVEYLGQAVQVGRDQEQEAGLQPTTARCPQTLSRHRQLGP